MKLSVAGQDRTSDLGQELGRRAADAARGAARHDPKPPLVAPDIMPLARARSEAEYLDQLISLLRCRNAVDTLDFAIPRKPGLAGLFMARIKAHFWKLLRYQHDRIAFQQNLVNIQLTSALEFAIAQHRKETADLKRRVAELEKQSGNCKA